jgi:hypothetical protein
LARLPPNTERVCLTARLPLTDRIGGMGFLSGDFSRDATSGLPAC